MTIDNNKFNQNNKGTVGGKQAGQGQGNVGGGAKHSQPGQRDASNPADRNRGLGDKNAKTPSQDQKFGSDKTAGGKNNVHGNTGSNNKDW